MRTAFFVLLWCAGCSGGDEKTDDTAETSETGSAALGPASLVLSFDLDADLIPTMDEPATGVFRGSVFAEADASAIGPNEGAVPLADIASPVLDFGTTGGRSPVSVTIERIAPQILWVVGCLDSDDNDCDCKDAVTLPNENKFDATSGENVLTITMSLLNPC